LRRGSVISSWLLDLTAGALAQDPQLKQYSQRVADSGEGRWTVQAAVDASVPAPVLTAALYSASPHGASRLPEPVAVSAAARVRRASGSRRAPPTEQPPELLQDKAERRGHGVRRRRAVTPYHRLPDLRRSLLPSDT
jgi:hypothetical protein